MQHESKSMFSSEKIKFSINECFRCLSVLRKKSENFGSKSVGTIIHRKIRSQIVDYLQRKSSFPWRSERAGKIALPLLFQFAISHFNSQKQKQEIKLKMVSAISFSWFAKRLSQPIYSEKWSAPLDSRRQFRGATETI